MRWDNKLREHKMNPIYTTKSSCMNSPRASHALPYRWLYTALWPLLRPSRPANWSLEAKRGNAECHLMLMQKIKSTAANGVTAIRRKEGGRRAGGDGVWEHLHLEHFTCNGGNSAHQSTPAQEEDYYALWAQLHPDTNSTVCQIFLWKQMGNEV